jgi:23S rRNA-/tRNA-specific pseudouridylate synthase
MPPIPPEMALLYEDDALVVLDKPAGVLVIASGAREASTDYRVRRGWRAGGQVEALVDATPHTGRHHQIRVHLRAIGTPILADPVYGRRVHVEVPWPVDLEAVRLWLDRHWTVESTS